MNLLLDFDGRRLLGARPFAVFEAKDSRFEIRGPQVTARSGQGDVLGEIRRLLQWSRENIATRGAAIGFFSYDFARTSEPRAFQEHSPPDELHLPDVRLVFCEELALTPRPPLPRIGRGGVQNVSLSFSPSPAARPGALWAAGSGGEDTPIEYSHAISHIKNYIAAGDIYQANYAARFAIPLPCSPSELFARLHNLHPAPFAAFLEWDDLAIVSNSPERFLKLENRILSTQPIKGTAPRGSTPEEDEANRLALQNSAKNRAENVMIVDLLRNDFGRVCEYGSIQVPELFATQTFPTLHHLVSTVTGVLREDCDALDAFAAAFPCGSITGAPKIRAMQIIDELETTRRGVSFGAIGYFGFNGDMEWNVAIRTITTKDGQAFFHTGGGIVEGSTVEDEYAEMKLKARALQQALSQQALQP